MSGGSKRSKVYARTEEKKENIKASRGAKTKQRERKERRKRKW